MIGLLFPTFFAKDEEFSDYYWMFGLSKFREFDLDQSWYYFFPDTLVPSLICSAVIIICSFIIVITALIRGISKNPHFFGKRWIQIGLYTLSFTGVYIIWVFFILDSRELGPYNVYFGVIPPIIGGIISSIGGALELHFYPKKK